MSGSDDHRPERRDEKSSPWSIAGVVLLWLVGLPAILMVCGLVGLSAGFAADAGEERDPDLAIAVVLVVGVIMLVGLSALIMGGRLDDDPPDSPPAPYAGRPLNEIPPVSSSSRRHPAKRHTTPGSPGT